MKNLLADVRTTEWYRLGLELGIDEEEMNIIEHDHKHSVMNALKATYNHWLHQITDPPPSWWEIVNALQQIKENSLAKKIKEKYCEPNTVDMCSTLFQVT